MQGIEILKTITRRGVQRRVTCKEGRGGSGFYKLDTNVHICRVTAGPSSLPYVAIDDVGYPVAGGRTQAQCERHVRDWLEVECRRQSAGPPRGDGAAGWRAHAG